MAVQARSIRGFLRLTAEKFTKTWLFFIGPILSIPMIALRRTLFDRRIRFLILVGLFAIPGLLAETWFHSHYIAPFIGIFYVMILQGMRHIRYSRLLSSRIRHALLLTIPTIVILMAAIAIATFPPRVQGRDFGIWCCNGNGPTARSRVIEQLEGLGGRHLVFVEYTSEHHANYEDEWVYNSADMDRSNVIFARHLDATRNAPLIQYYPDRQVWHLLIGHAPLKLERYKVPDERLR